MRSEQPVKLVTSASSTYTQASTRGRRVGRAPAFHDAKYWIPSECSGGFLYFTGANAGRADTHLLPVARYQCSHPFQVGIPPAPSRIVRVADHVPEMRPFAAQLTLHRHIIPASSSESLEPRVLYSSRPHPNDKACLSVPSPRWGYELTCLSGLVSQHSYTISWIAFS